MSYFNKNNLGGQGQGPRRNAPSPGGHGQYDPDPYHDNSDIYSQYSQPSFVSNNNINNGNNLTNRYQSNANVNAPPSSYTPAQTAYPAASYTPNPTAYTAPGPGDYFGTSQAPTAIQPRPSFSSSHHPYQDYDDTKSYASSANLNKEWGMGQVVPPVPTMPINQGYPPRNPYAVSPSAYAAPQTPGGTAHWHQVRNQLMERRVVKQIPLINGNLVMDVPVPKGCVTGQGGLGCMPDEMEKMRYSAATCDPDDFMRKKFSLRSYLYGRKTELFIVMTMYNEDDVLFLRTLNAVIKNIAHLTTRTRFKTWGPESWQKVVVCIVADGRKVIDSRVLKILQLMGVYAEVSRFSLSCSYLFGLD
jgi:chitin synthase